MTQLDSFETALLTELRDHVARREAPRAHLPRRRFAVAGAGVAAAAVVGVILVPGLGPTPAYSVLEGNSGEIRVEVNRLEDAAGLERAIEEYGVEADVTYVPDGGQCAPGRYESVQRSLTGLSTSIGREVFEVTLPPGAVREGETFVISASVVRLPATGDPDGDGISDMGGLRVWTDFDVARGAVAPCEVIATEDGS